MCMHGYMCVKILNKDSYLNHAGSSMNVYKDTYRNIHTHTQYTILAEGRSRTASQNSTLLSHIFSQKYRKRREKATKI